MSIIIHGQNISKNQEFSQYSFTPSNKQINILNDMCFGRLDTPLKSIQFNFNCDQDLLKDCYIQYNTYAIEFISAQGALHLQYKSENNRVYFKRAFYSIQQFFNFLLSSTKIQTESNGLTFEQGFEFNDSNLQEGYFTLSYYIMCVRSTVEGWPVDRVNMDSKIINGLQPGRNPYFKVIFHGQNLIKMLGLQQLPAEWIKYTQSYYDDNVKETIEPLITLSEEELICKYYAGNIKQNFMAFSPVWWVWDQYLYQAEEQVTRDGQTYTVPEHYDWDDCFYIEGLKYKYSQWRDRQTNIQFNPTLTYTDTSLFQLQASQAYFLQIYHYLLFDCPQLAPWNLVDEQGRVYNIIAKTINNTNPNQYFTMTTTEPLKKLTLQNLAGLSFVMTIYDQDLSLTRAYKEPVMIITLNRLAQEEEELRDLRKTFDGTNINIQSQ